MTNLKLQIAELLDSIHQTGARLEKLESILDTEEDFENKSRLMDEYHNLMEDYIDHLENLTIVQETVIQNLEAMIQLNNLSDAVNIH